MLQLKSIQSPFMHVINLEIAKFYTYSMCKFWEEANGNISDIMHI